MGGRLSEGRGKGNYEFGKTSLLRTVQSFVALRSCMCGAYAAAVGKLFFLGEYLVAHQPVLHTMEHDM